MNKIDLILSDLYRISGSKKYSSFVSCFFKYPTFRFLVYLRLAPEKFQFLNPKIIFKLLHRKYFFKYGLQIPVSTKIGKGFYIGHFSNIIISHNAVIGKNCNISSGVVIGGTNRGENKGCPTIGNNVWIGSNAVIVGKIKIGDNVLIAPNSFVNKNIPSNSIVIGNPSLVKENHMATENYINNTT